MDDSTIWERCNSCRKPIHFGEKYFLCSVSTCKNPRTGVRFCSADCWDAHLGSARHREAWAEDAIAPRQGSAPTPRQASPAQKSATPPHKMVDPAPYGNSRPPVRKIIDSPPPSSTDAAGSSTAAVPKDLDTLIVVSKVKQLIKDHSGFSTSQCCIDALTAKVAEAAIKAIESAESAGRKTVMGRDVR